MNPSHNIYIHVPFCVSRCKYCAFFSNAVVAPDWDTYASDIVAEIEHWNHTLGRVTVPTVFFGGGTPSLMPVNIFERIMNAIRDNFDVATGAEVTLESNPGTLSAQKLKDFITAGVNRLSIGVQAITDARLEFLGRRHSVRDAVALIDAAQNTGIRVSGDFIYGLPGDGVDDVVAMCRWINNLGLTHCSMYELTIEPSTPFGKMNLDMPDNDTMADMYGAIADTLRLPRYEVSNYATLGNECVHNMNVWDGDAYIGIGRGAAGRIFMNGIWYEQRGANVQFDAMDNHTRGVEVIITGLRQTRGARICPLTRDIINMNFVENNPELIYTSGDRIIATRRGMLILDDMLGQVIK